MSAYHKDPEFAVEWPDFLPPPRHPFWGWFFLALVVFGIAVFLHCVGAL